MYAEVVGRSLRLRGMSVVLEKIKSITEKTLAKTLITLQTPKLYAQAAASNGEMKIFKDYTAQEKVNNFIFYLLKIKKHKNNCYASRNRVFVNFFAQKKLNYI